MANPTTNFGWVMPTSTSLVTNLPADFNTFGQGVDTSMAQLKGGSTGQVLSKTSATDMAFTWITPTDQTPLTTKGDLFTFTTVDARLAVGNNGESLVSDSSTSTGLRYQGSMAAGKNILINGGFDIWQRGTSSASTGYTTADRWYMNAATTTFSQETTTVPTGVRYALKALTSGTTTVQFRQAVETLNAIQFAGKTVVLSGEYQASTTTTIQTKLFYSTSVDNSVTGSWTEITATTGGTVSAVSGSYTKSSSVFAVPSTAKSLMVLFDTGSVASAVSLYYGKIQLELGSVATEFERAGGTIQGELAACQRYYYRNGTGAGYQPMGFGLASSSTNGMIMINFPVPMRTSPASIDFSTLQVNDTTVGTAVSAVAYSGSEYGTMSAVINATTSGMTTYRPVKLLANNSATGYLGFSAEL